MVGQATLKGYNFDSIEMYFDYIVESEANGQRKQAISLFNKLSKNQKLDFYDFFNANNSASDFVKILNVINEHKKFKS